jgi:hypothetical protein
MTKTNFQLFLIGFCLFFSNRISSQSALTEKYCEVNSISFWIKNQPITTNPDDVIASFGKKYEKKEIDENNMDLIFKKSGLIFHFHNKSLMSFEIIPLYFKGKTDAGLELGRNLRVEDLINVYDLNKMEVRFDKEYCNLYLAKGNGGATPCAVIFSIKVDEKLNETNKLSIQEYINYFKSDKIGKSLIIDRIKINPSFEIGTMGF